MGIPHAVTGSQPGPVTLELFISDRDRVVALGDVVKGGVVLSALKNAVDGGVDKVEVPAGLVFAVECLLIRPRRRTRPQVASNSSKVAIQTQLPEYSDGEYSRPEVLNRNGSRISPDRSSSPSR